VPKSINILHCNDILVFHVPRRFQSVNVAKLHTNIPFVQLPVSVNGWESLNDYPVSVDPMINIYGDDFKLKSVVFVDCTQDNSRIIIGNSTGIIIYPNGFDNLVDTTYIIYDPANANKNIYVPSIDLHGSYNPPVYEVAGENPLLINEGYPGAYTNTSFTESFYERATKRGTLFIYKKVGSTRKNPFVINSPYVYNV